MFDDADEKLEQALAKPDGDSGQAAEKNESNESAQMSQPQTVELDKLERFMYQGKEWTPSQLKDAMLMQADYTRKTQALAEERKYYDNLREDLRFIRENPHLADEFRKTYPEKFHAYLDDLIAGGQVQAATEQAGQRQAALPPELQSEWKTMRETLNGLQSAWTEQEKAKASAHIDAMFAKFTSKYDMADERTVLATAREVAASGKELTEKEWERIFKQEHEYFAEKSQKRQQAQMHAQKEANAKARDVGSGGGIPGQAPKKRSFDEATADAIRHLSGQGV